jgi:glycosidase
MRAINALACPELGFESRDFKAYHKMDDDTRARGRRLVRMASCLQYMYPGSPSIYYGDEIGMQGFEDPFNRAFFRWNDLDNKVNKWYKALCNIRNSISAFIDGEVSNLYANKGLISYTRKDDSSEVLVIVNADNNAHTIKFDGRLLNLIDGNTYENLIEIKGQFCGIFVNND